MDAPFVRNHRTSLLATAAGFAGLALAVGIATPGAAQLGPLDRGYVGPAFLDVPGVSGGWKGAPFKNWVRVESHYWKIDAAMRPMTAQAQAAPGARSGQANAIEGGQGRGRAQGQASFTRRRAYLTVPGAPREGDGTLVIAVDKRNPGLPSLMEKCRSNAVVPEVSYAVSALRSRTRLEMGPVPEGMPDYFDFKLKNVQFTECPVVDKAPEQAFVVKYGDILWSNWQRPDSGAAVALQPAVLRPIARPTGQTRAWVVTWIAMAHDVRDDQCPVMNAKPTEADYYTYLPKDVAEKERAALAGKGGPNYENGQMGFRGPNRLNVTYLPGIVPDPGMVEPQTTTARGLNLDNDDGKKRKHKNYVSEDGKITGIDNQLYTVMGCVAGWQGHKGFLLQFANNQYRDGELSMLIEVSGIDDDRNDDQVDVTIRYSQDPMVKSGAGDRILQDFTYDVTDKPEFSHYFVRLPGRIVDGAVVTDPVKTFRLNLGVYGIPPELTMSDARLRLELKPDGTIKGVLGGYRDWREIAGSHISSSSEFYHGFQQPALYNALKRNADGIKDPVTGEYDGISSAYDIEGVPAFVVDQPQNIASDQATPQKEARAETGQGAQRPK